MNPRPPELRIRGGRVIDPAEGCDEIRDLWIDAGKVVAAPTDPDVKATRTIDASGMVVMPGGVDMHSHLFGSKVTAARSFLPRQNANPQTAYNPIPSELGLLYLGLGYTTAIDAAIAPLGARQAVLESAELGAIDRAFLVLLANNHYVMDQIRDREPERLKAYVSWMLKSTRAWGVKAVNPGGVERWKQGKGNVSSLDDRVDGFDVTPRSILQSLAETVDDLKLPHPLHVHCNNLGLPGNWSTTLATMKALEGRRAHLTHIQFHSYGGTLDKPTSIRSKVPILAEYVNSHAGLTVDVGQVIFGDTVSMTADGPVGEYLAELTHRPWLSHDIELETGCGVVPIRYEEQSLVHATQWAIGLEWFLSIANPWQIALSTDHPNGGSFLAYPQIIALLMNKELRKDYCKRLPAKLASRSALVDHDREYTLSEIAVVTRAAPARILGLATKGRLSPGADADVTIYQPGSDIERMFARPRYVLFAGKVRIDDGIALAEGGAQPDRGVLMSAATAPDPGALAHIRDWFERSSTIAWRNFPIAEETEEAGE